MKTNRTHQIAKFIEICKARNETGDQIADGLVKVFGLTVEQAIKSL